MLYNYSIEIAVFVPNPMPKMVRPSRSCPFQNKIKNHTRKVKLKSIHSSSKTHPRPRPVHIYSIYIDLITIFHIFCKALKACMHVSQTSKSISGNKSILFSQDINFTPCGEIWQCNSHDFIVYTWFCLQDTM